MIKNLVFSSLILMLIQGCLIEPDVKNPEQNTTTEYHSEHFDYSLPPGFFDPSQIKKIALVHEQAYQNLKKFFHNSPQRINTTWAYNIELYQKAAAENRKNYIIYDLEYYNYKSDLRSNTIPIITQHEIAHSFQLANLSDYPIKLYTEGMASAFQSEFDSCSWNINDTYGHTSDGATLMIIGEESSNTEDIILDNLINGLNSTDAYLIGSRFNRFLYLKLGQNLYFQFIEATIPYGNSEQAAQTLGLSWSILLNEFKQINAKHTNPFCKS